MSEDSVSVIDEVVFPDSNVPWQALGQRVPELILDNRNSVLRNIRGGPLDLQKPVSGQLGIQNVLCCYLDSKLGPASLCAGSSPMEAGQMLVPAISVCNKV